jgi:CRISPR-associated endonuclease/helicase Cas3
LIEDLEKRTAHLWAKSPPRAGGEGHPLLAHTLDVCRQAEEFYRAYRPRWPISDDASLPRILAYAALLHDFGKAHCEFQSMLRGGPRFKLRHEILSLAFLRWLDIPQSEYEWLAAAIATHHKEAGALPLDQYTALPERLLPMSDLGHLASGLPGSDEAPLRLVLANAGAMLNLAGWVGIEPYPLRAIASTDIPGGMLEAVHRVVAHVARLNQERPKETPGWNDVRAAIHTRGWLIDADHLASYGPRQIEAGLQRVTDVRDALQLPTLHDHQRILAETNGSALLVAPTGSGKTEAALLWAAAQAESGAHGRMCLMLPYQASMNAMQTRLLQTLHPALKDTPEAWNESVSLTHGRSMRAIFERLLERNYGSGESAWLARRQNELGYLYAAPISVSSPWSAIRLLFATRGAEALLASFSGARMVLDEIHAYEPEVTAKALAAVRFIARELGGRALFMTATLPTHLRDVLDTVLPGLSMVAAGADVLDRPPRHRIRLMPFAYDSAEALATVGRHAERGSVLVVVNQVKRARHMYSLLRERGLDCILLHSRFTYADRARIERAIEPTAGRVLVSTQAVEVSLDVSFDSCFSELAPIESLLQRFGRCNRYGKRSPTDVCVFSTFSSDQARAYLPYNADHLANVLKALRTHCDRVPSGELNERAVTALIDESYSEAMRNALLGKTVQHVRDVQESLINHFSPYGYRDSGAMQQLERAWQELFDGDEVLPVSLRDKALAETPFVARARYLVPISAHRAHFYSATWDPELLCQVTSRPYDSETGLA